MANIPQWKVGDVLSASKLNAMVDAINDLLAGQTGNNDVYITLNELNDILKQYSDIGHTHSVSEIVDLVLPTKLSQLQNDTSYVTEDYVINAIANAQLGGDGEVDLSAYATKNYVDSIIQDYTGGKKQVYLTQAEYDALNDDDKNDETKVYNIIDVEDTVADSLILTSPNGSKFVIIVSDDGTLSAAPYGNIEPEDPVEPTLISISAIYTQGETVIYPDSSLDDLRTSLVVTANYSDGTSNNITDYTLSGELTVGTSVITVLFEDKTTIFNVEVSSNSQTPVDPEEPASYTNYIYNEDTFTNPAQGTTTYAGTYYYTSAETDREVVETGVLKISNNTAGTNGAINIRHSKGDNNVYYIQFKVKSEAGIIAGSPQETVLSTSTPVEDWTMVSYIYTDSSAPLYAIKLALNNNGAIPGVAYIKEPMRINLTEIYGAGNEPKDVAVCDEAFATFVPGLRG